MSSSVDGPQRPSSRDCGPSGFFSSVGFVHVFLSVEPPQASASVGRTNWVFGASAANAAEICASIDAISSDAEMLEI